MEVDPVSSKFLENLLGDEVVRVHLNTFKKELTSLEREKIDKLLKENHTLLEKCDNLKTELGKHLISIKNFFKN